MSASVLVDTDPVRRPSGSWPRIVRGVARGAAAAAAVAAFWYGATGTLLALERSAATRVLALGVAAGAAALGIACTRAARQADAAGTAGAGDAARAVLGGALLWTCVSAGFYGGWIVGPARAIAGALAGQERAPSVPRALDALAATAYSSALAALLLAVALWAARAPADGSGGTRDRPPRDAAARFAPATFAALWAAHELAKLNVFAGVANAGADYLPPYLAHLRQFFGPARNSPLLAWSVAALAAAAIALGWGALRAPAPARRTGLALLAGIVALAAFEHAALGARTPLDWWRPFLAWRGGR